jgi:glycosyltransferase involved in cell wall biosynthesis
MKILVLNHNIEGEGTWHRAWNFAVQLQQRGHNVTFVTVNPCRRLRSFTRMHAGVRVCLSPYLISKRMAASGVDLWDIMWRIAIVMRWQWDLLYAFSSLPSVGLPQLMARRFLKGRHIVSDWDDLFCDGGGYEYLNRGWTRPIYWFERWLEISTKRQADGVTVTSHYLFEKAKAIRRDDRLAYVPTGANVKTIPCYEKKAAREVVPVPVGKVILVYMAGGFGQDVVLLLKAYAIALRSVPELHLMMVTKHDEKINRLLRELDLEGAVMVMGWVPYAKIPHHLGVADILMAPLEDSASSRARGPIKLRDYLCAGRPIIGTALGEVGHVLSHFKVGCLADLPSEDFAATIIELARKPEDWETLGREARRVAECELSWDVMGERIEQSVSDWCGFEQSGQG